MADRNRAKSEEPELQNDTANQQEQAHSDKGRGWHGNSEGHAEAGRKGGRTVSRNREHMAQIGRKGGQTVSRNREHMAQIGRKGGQARGTRDTDGGGNASANEGTHS